MHMDFGRLVRILLVLGIELMLSGCPTVSSPLAYASNGIGGEIEPLLKAVDREHSLYPETKLSRQDILAQRYILPNGNTVYPLPENFQRCNLHWEVNPAGKIVGYRYEEVIEKGCNW
jgi:hypothetical protein